MIKRKNLDTIHTHRSRLVCLAIVAAILILPGVSVSTTTLVGRYTVVPNGLESKKPQQTRSYSVRVGANVVVGEQIESGTTSAAQLLFGEGVVVNLAPETSLRIGEDTDKAGGPAIIVLKLTHGLLRIFVSRTLNPESGVHISTPMGNVVVSAAEAAVEIDKNKNVRVTHLGKTGSVRWQAIGMGAHELAPESQWLTATSGRKPEAKRLEISAENKLRRRTEPLPSLPQERPRARRYEDYDPGHLQGRLAPKETVRLSTGICGSVIYNPGAARFTPNPVSTEIQVFDDSGALRTQQTSNAQGNYEISLEPGRYRVVLPEYGVVFDDVSVPAESCTDPKLRINAP